MRIRQKARVTLRKNASQELPGRSLAESLFRSRVKRTLSDLHESISSELTREQMARLISDFLTAGSAKVGTRKRNGLKSTATCWEAIEDGLLIANPEQYRNVVVHFQTRPDFRVLSEMIVKLEEAAEECGLRRKDVGPCIAVELERLLPDERPESVKRGEFCERIISELKEIRARRAEFRTFEQLHRRCEVLTIPNMLTSAPFDEEDRELLVTPNRWGNLVTYATGLLKRYFGRSSGGRFREKSPSTIKYYRQEFKYWLKTCKRNN